MRLQAWSLKLSPTYTAAFQLSGNLGIFLFEVLELCRRAVWTVLRVEHEQNKVDGLIESSTDARDNAEKVIQ